MNWRNDVWFFDTEVLPHDWLICAMTEKGEKVSFHNDAPALVDWLNFEAPFLCGYNSKHYDIYILKAILAGAPPEEVKEVSDAIIVKGVQGWEIEMGYVTLPKSFDLMLDLPLKPSLKLIEGNLKMDIRESSVDFTTENPTQEEWKELENYCWHDVSALIPLYKAREGYLEAKETLAEMKGIPVKQALNMTNAKLTALFLDAKRIERTDERQYVFPTNLKYELIPESVISFFKQLPESDIPLPILFGDEGVEDEDGKTVKSRNPYRNVSVAIGNCPTVIAWGGAHGAINNYAQQSNEELVILNVDVQSYYPSLMIQNNYLSRNVPYPQVFKEVFERRIEAKLSGDEKTANALKLVLNTTYGASNNKYNDLYDPLMAHSVCISGQLYLVQLAQELYHTVPQLTIIQINTDGIMVSVPVHAVSTVKGIIQAWERQTGFRMEETEIERIVQRDVNNYVMREKGGKVKVKGGVVSSWKGGDFNRGSLSVISKAVVSYLLDGTPIDTTIMGETNPFAFQMIVKAGGSFERVVHEIGGMDFTVNRVNRIYAGLDSTLGVVYKIKAGRRNKVPNCPEHAIVDNSGEIPLDKIDRKWYSDLAQERADEFFGGKKKKC